MVWHFMPLEKVPKLTRETFVPRLEAADRPSKVMVAVITDGEENESHEFTRSRIGQMVRRKI